MYSYTLNQAKLNRIGEYIKSLRKFSKSFRSLRNCTWREELVKFMQNRSRVQNISPSSPKFIRQYLPARINRGQKSTPYARLSHKQGRSRSTSRKGRGSPLVLVAEVFRNRVYKRDALVREGYFAPSPPLIPKVHKY